MLDHEYSVNNFAWDTKIAITTRIMYSFENNRTNDVKGALERINTGKEYS